jgi:hypothetical protein
MDEIRVRFQLEVSSDDTDPTSFVSFYKGEVFGEDDSDDDLDDEFCGNEVKVGEIDLYLVNRGRIIDEGASLFEAMDATSSETMECYEALIDQETEDWKQEVQELISEDGLVLNDILLIRRLELVENLRGRGIGATVAAAAIRVLGSNCAVITCKPFPLQYEGWGDPSKAAERVAEGFERKRDEAFRKVSEFWVEAGFKPLPGSGHYVWSPNRVNDRQAGCRSWSS